jgi:uroporphyrinogen decarboxylase
MNARERFLAACRREPVDRPPVWLMRQAGRYLPEYQAIREKHSFWEMVRTPALATEVTLQPIQRYGMDAAILFSDILVVPDALGLEVRYTDTGPVIEPLVRTKEDVERLAPVEADSAYAYMGEAIERLCAELHPDRAVLGFAGAPFTLAAYLVEGGPSKSTYRLKQMAYQAPEVFDGLCSRVADAVADLLALQIRAGADMVQVFDTWAVHLSPADYERLALPYTQRVFEKIAGLGTPATLYLRNAAGHLEAAATSGCSILSVDTSIRLADARRRLPDSVGMQGNFDPALLTAPAETIRAEVHAGIEAAGLGYIVNLGQGCVPATPVEGVAAFVRAVQEYR